MKNKEIVISDFIKMIKNSWTYEKMTKEEQKRLIELLANNRIIESIKGNYVQRWTSLQAIYYTYLMGLDYKAIGWRDESESF